MLWFQDSFDIYNTAYLPQRYTAIAGIGNISLQPNGRTGVQALNVTTVSTPSYVTIKGLNIVIPTGGLVTWWIGAALYIPAGMITAVGQYIHPWLFPQLGAVSGLGMQIRGDGSLYNAFTGATAPAGTFTFGAWNYVEMAVTVNQSTMTIETTYFVNDIQVADATATATSLPTNVTTAQLGIPAMNAIGAGGVTVQIDDLYLCDSTGQFANARCGDVDIYQQLPQGPGRVSNVWQNNGVGGAANWQNCNAFPPATTAYITDATAGDEECFAMTPINAPSSNIIAMQVSVLAQKSAATGNRNITGGIGNGQAEGFGPGAALTNAWQYYMFPYSYDPVTGGAFDPYAVYQGAVQTVT